MDILFVIISDVSGKGLSDMHVEFETHLETVSQAMLVTSETAVPNISDYCVNSVVVNNHL